MGIRTRLSIVISSNDHMWSDKEGSTVSDCAAAMKPSLKYSRSHEVIDQWSVRLPFFPHLSVLTYCWFQFAITSEDEYQCFKSSNRDSSMGLVPWGFRRRAPAVLRPCSRRHWSVLFFSIDEGWWAWPLLTVTCTVLPWWGHVLSMILGSRRIGSGAGATICFNLADDPMMMIAFITINFCLVPLIEGLCAQI